MSGQCLACRARDTDAYLCHTCTADVINDLRALVEDPPDRAGSLLADLDLALARAVRMGTTLGVRAGGDTALPYGLAAAETADIAKNTFTAWIRTLAAARGRRVAIRATLDGMARWLILHHEQLRQLPPSEWDGGAGQAYDELRHVAQLVRATVDRPAPRWYAGTCDECAIDMFGRAHNDGTPTDTEITCPGCRTTYSSTERRGWMLASARDREATAATISQALSRWLGDEVTPAMIRGYVHRGHLHRQGYNHAGSPLYRLGDVIDCVTRAAEHKRLQEV